MAKVVFKTIRYQLLYLPNITINPVYSKCKDRIIHQMIIAIIIEQNINC